MQRWFVASRVGPRRGEGTGRRHAGTNPHGRLAGLVREELIEVGAAQGHDEIEAVQQRGREPAGVAGAIGHCAAAGSWVDPLSAGARIHGGDQEETSGEGRGAAGPADPDHPLFERLAQRLERGDRELPHLVEEKHAVAGQADLAWAQRPAPPAHQRHDRRPVVRRAKRRLADEHTIGRETAGGGVHPRHRERLLGREGGQEPRQAFGQHRLARPGRAHHEEVVPPRRRDLEGVAAQALPPHIGQVGNHWRHGSRARRREGWPRVPGAQETRQLGQRCHAVGGVPPDQGRLTGVAQGHDQPVRCRRIGQRDHAGHVAQRAVQAELAAEGQPLGAGRRELPRRHQDAHGDGQVEPGARFAHARWCKVDGDPPQRPREPAREQGCTHPVARLAHGGVGEPDDGEPGQPVGDMDLDRDRTADRAGQRGGSNGGEHAEERSPLLRKEDRGLRRLGGRSAMPLQAPCVHFTPTG